MAELIKNLRVTQVQNVQKTSVMIQTVVETLRKVMETIIHNVRDYHFFIYVYYKNKLLHYAGHIRILIKFW